jgi:hypothetical protein
MEVHHHPDLHHKKKNFKEYFLEFLMIFLAVTLGFIAENLRENINKDEREHTLMEMFVGDLKDDVGKLDSSIAFNTRKEIYLDSLRKYSVAAANEKLSNSAYRMMYYIYVAYGYNSFPFQPSKRTLDQFEKSDAFSFIGKQNVSDSIQSYNENDNDIMDQHVVFLETQSKEHDIGETIFDISLFDECTSSKDAPELLLSDKQFTLLTNDKNALLLFASGLFYDRGVLINYIIQLKSQRENAERLISLIQKEYHLENE